MADSVAQEQLRSFVERAPLEIAAFAEKMAPARERYAYCSSVLAHDEALKSGRRYKFFDERGVPSCERFLKVNARFKLRMLHREDFDAVDARLRRFGSDGLVVGPVEPWQVGHVYFVRLAAHPHIVKIGFSRRVPNRIADLEQKAGGKLIFCAAKVGIMALEAWWHFDWRKYRIDGEWFFDPRSADRSVPDFLTRKREAA